jgi:hypothetical protein
MRRTQLVFLAITFLFAIRPAPGQEAELTLEQVVDRVIGREAVNLDKLRHRHPIVEVYLQDLRHQKGIGYVPTSDEYFLGKAYMPGDMELHSLLGKSGKGSLLKLYSPFGAHPGMRFIPNGFAGMSYVDARGFNKANYKFEYIHKEFLGEVRCMVFDVAPQNPQDHERFKGRIWVEDQDFNIVRFNGIFTPPARPDGWNFHFDSWRTQMGPGLWLPAYIYVEETNLKYGSRKNLQFKGQTRFWGYDLKADEQESEFSTVKVDALTPVRDASISLPDNTPIEAVRHWDRQAEDNALDRLERAGLLAPEGDVDRILETVVTNLEITNKLDVEPPIRCRVLLTSTLESFSVGHTIVLSRGLLDVLPDEASLAAMLAFEMGHILLVPDTQTEYAFFDRMQIPDEDVINKFRFRNDGQEKTEAEKKAIALLRNSPYGNNLASAGLFLRALEARSKELPRLISPHLGNRILNMKELESGAPAIEAKSIDQIAALPLGSRVKVDPWTDRLDLLKPKAVKLFSLREKMSFEVTPFWPYLTRQNSGATPVSLSVVAKPADPKQ